MRIAPSQPVVWFGEIIAIVTSKTNPHQSETPTTVLELVANVHGFFDRLKVSGVQIYNEFSLQHELGVYLRSVVAQDSCRVQFERPTGFFGIPSDQLLKKEIDIAVFGPDQTHKAAIELKFPRNGQYPEQMFSACKDVAFLEQLVERGFESGLFVMAADDKLFYQGADAGGVYSCFRSGKPICGLIRKPTGAKNESFTMRGSYILTWHKLPDLELRYACISVVPAIAKLAAIAKPLDLGA
jgi:hypothetical protein